MLLYTRFRRCFPLYTHLVPVTLCYYSADSLCRRLISDGGFIRLKRKGSFDWGIPLAAAAGIAGFILGSLLNGVRVSYPKCGLGDIRLCILSAICGTLFYFFLFKKNAWISGSRILARLGENSLFIMAAHYWLLRLAEMISMRFFGYSVWKNRNTLKALLVTFIAIVLIMLFRDIYVKLFGKNKTMMKIAGYFGMK